MKTLRLTIATIALAAAAAPLVEAGELQPDTLQAWNAYLKEADSRMQERIAGRQPFLWLDESPDRVARIRRGEAVIAPVVGEGSENVPHGLIHDWIGGVFIRGAKINDVLAVIHDYDNYERIYQPVVITSKTLASADNTQEFQMTWQRKVLFVRAAMQGRYYAHDVMLDEHRGFSAAEALEVREIEAYGHPRERLLPPGTGRGFIWRIRSVARYEERDGGVFLELQATALTRDIPGSVAWLVTPVVNRLSVNSLTSTLCQTRDAVFASQHNLKASASLRTPSPVVHKAKAGVD